MPDEGRRELAARQAALVAALAGRAAPPLGFDADRLRATAVSLANKRRRAVARAWPGLTDALGDRFAERFDAYAKSAPLPSDGGPLADGRAFLRWLTAAGEPVLACEMQQFAVDLRFRWTNGGLTPRRGLAVKFARLGKPRRTIIAVRLPWLGEHWFRIRS